MSKPNLTTRCNAQDKDKCRYHNPKSKDRVQDAIQRNDYSAFEKAQSPLTIDDSSFKATDTNFVHEPKFRNIKKMPALFVIDRVAHLATTDINEKAAWIFTEESKATVKRDGTSITITEDGAVFARRTVKKGKAAPPGFILAEKDSFTGHSFGLEPISQSVFKKMFTEASNGQSLPAGTYELCGPKVNGNPDGLSSHELVSHGSGVASEIPDMRNVPREQAFETLKTIFTDYRKRGIEGVVWWGADGKRTKLRTNDFFGDPHRQ